MKDVIIGDINGDGSTELVISLTDRVVSTGQSEASTFHDSQSDSSTLYESQSEASILYDSQSEASTLHDIQ